MTCTQCNSKEVTSPKVTGELCTFCFFKAKNGKAHLSERAPMSVSTVSVNIPTFTPESTQVITPTSLEIITIKDDKQYYTCNECNELHLVPDSNKERVCTTVHAPGSPT